jgi:outer membrane protein assembly factor BamB
VAFCVGASVSAGALKLHFDELLTRLDAAGVSPAGSVVYPAGPNADPAGPKAKSGSAQAEAEPGEGGHGLDRTTPTAGSSAEEVEGNGPRQVLQSAVATPEELAAPTAVANLELSTKATIPTLTAEGYEALATGGTVGPIGLNSDQWVDPRSSLQPWSVLGAMEGLLTFRGNPTRSFYGQGPVPMHPSIAWTLDIGCSPSAVGSQPKVWCGSGWTGQPAVFRSPTTSRWWLAFGAYNRAVNFLDPATGSPVFPPYYTEDIIKGSVTADPDGYPLLYTGSRDNYFHVVALDRPQPTALWKLSADAVQPTLWNNDWDGSSLVIDDYLFEGGENGRFFIVKLNRGYGPDGLVTVDPRIVFSTESWDTELLQAIGDLAVSVENSVAISGNTVYFANSGGLVQGWDISGLARGEAPTRVLRFWTGDDTDASLVIDGNGMVYAVSQYERGTQRSRDIGQIMKLDPSHPDNPLVWSRAARAGLESGVWATPALYQEPSGGTTLIVPTNEGQLMALDAATGADRWSVPLPGPLWSSPVVVDGTLVQGDCAGSLHAFDLAGRPSTAGAPPVELWSTYLGGCIESTPAVWNGQIFVGTRIGQFFALSDG